MVAELSDWTDITGNSVDLKAYYPIPIALNSGRYISGPSRIIYNYTGSSPNYDENPYILYDNYGNKVEVARWEMRFPGWDSIKDNKPLYFTDKIDGNKTTYW